MHIRLLLGSLVLLAALPAHAGINKCVNAAGVVSFSDKPCAANEGEKKAEIKAESGLGAAISRENDRNLGKNCWLMQRRYLQCRGIAIRQIHTYLEENCKAPFARYEKDLAQANANKAAARRKGIAQSEENEYVNAIYAPISAEELKCDALQNDMWDFVKSNFGKKISEQDMKALDYQTKAIPSSKKH